MKLIDRVKYTAFDLLIVSNLFSKGFGMQKVLHVFPYLLLHL